MQKRRRCERRFRPGMLVRIGQDCRPGGTETGSEAIYEGLFDSVTGQRYKGSRAGEQGMPKMTLPDGSTIWGFECWWLPLKEALKLEASTGSKPSGGQRFPDPDILEAVENHIKGSVNGKC